VRGGDGDSTTASIQRLSVPWVPAAAWVQPWQPQPDAVFASATVVKESVICSHGVPQAVTPQQGRPT